MSSRETSPLGSPRRAVPRVRELLADTLSPIEVYRRLSSLSPIRFLFESVTGGQQVSRFSFLGAAPAEVYRLWPDRLEVERDGQRQALPGKPLDALRQVLRQVSAEPGALPFTGGFVGFFGYDLIRMVERLPHRPPDSFDLPVALLARFNTVLVFDHAQQRVLAVANEIDGEVSSLVAEQQLAELTSVLSATAAGRGLVLPRQLPGPVTDAVPALGAREFRRAVGKAKEYITAGDIFQVVLARRWVIPRQPDPLSLYRALRMVNPSPYMVLLETQETSLIGASPEMLVRKKGRLLETRPIAGTRHRGVDSREDLRLAEDLLGDPKERAEHVMLVDLGRNDLGRVAEPGSVEVASFMEVERYSHVMHMVSSVIANLREDQEGLDALLACFPAGTVSGAPKIRAMEIIDELEPESRGPYAGAVGYFSYTGDVDTCITIRTLVSGGGETSVTAGAGIVADSDPTREQFETESKAAGMLAAIALAELLEEGGS